jgi:hypothetical protein
MFCPCIRTAAARPNTSLAADHDRQGAVDRPHVAAGDGSNISTPSARRAASERVTTGEMVLMSTITDPRAAPSATPPGPKITCSTSGVSDTMVKITSDPRAASAGDAHAVAPASLSGCMDSGRRAFTRSAWPPLRRFKAMGRPMMPSPTKVMFKSNL